jgi:uncharacterized membrane protein
VPGTDDESRHDDGGGGAAEPEDPRLAFVYQEALRGLLQQQAAVESMHNRAATLIFAAAFASSLLGGRALSDGLNGGWEWLGVGLLLGIGLLAVVVLWPYYNLSFRFDAEELLADYVDSESPATMPEMHRALALRIKAEWHANGRLVKRMREAFQAALILLLLDLVAWLLAVASVSAS